MNLSEASDKLIL